VTSTDWPREWPEDDRSLADAIGVHARSRIARGQEVSLREYLARIPGIESKPVSLDIAIEAALLSATGARAGRRDIERAGKTLAAEYPEFRGPIMEAATLSSMMCSTGALRARLHADLLPTPPCEFGPAFTRTERRFRLVGLLGMGAHGAVYLAIDRALSEADKPAQVAIKVMLTEPTEGDAVQISDEGAKARRVDHPNVVRVYDAGSTEEGLGYIVTEYVSGGSLRKGQRAIQTPAPPADAARLVAQIAEGVQGLHSAGLIHFDLKPDNILITEDGTPKVADLSLAVRESDRLIREDGADPTPGTVGFMAPEQVRAQADLLDARCDIYALGGILFWLLTGEFPNRSALSPGWVFDEEKANASRASLLARCPRDLRAIVLRALETDPERRQRTAAQVADDLRTFLAGKPIAWTRPAPGRVAALWIRRHPAVTASIFAAVTGVAIAGVMINGLSRESERRAVEARIAAARLESETEWKQTAGPRFLAILQGQWTKLINAGVVGETFATLWMTEWLFGPAFLDDLETQEATRRERLVLLKTIFDDSVGEQGDESVHTLVYGTATAYWALTLDEPATARAVLDRFTPAWRARLTAGDRWAIVLDVLEGCTALQSTSAQNDPVAHAARVAYLRVLRETLAGYPDGKPLRELIDRLTEPPSEAQAAVN
jgi:hypothetical protein